MTFSFTGKAAIAALIVTGVVVGLCVKYPELLGWLFGMLYTGPR